MRLVALVAISIACRSAPPITAKLAEVTRLLEPGAEPRRNVRYHWTPDAWEGVTVRLEQAVKITIVDTTVHAQSRFVAPTARIAGRLETSEIAPMEALSSGS